MILIASFWSSTTIINLLFFLDYGLFKSEKRLEYSIVNGFAVGQK